jgi:hypothetical protein
VLVTLVGLRPNVPTRIGAGEVPVYVEVVNAALDPLATP